MLTELKHLKLLEGVTSAKDPLALAAHVAITQNRAYASNGKVWVHVPFPLLKGFEGMLNAERFLSAMEKCETAKAWSHTVEGDVLAIKAGKLRVKLPVKPIAGFPIPVTQGVLACPSDFIAVLNEVYPFVWDGPPEASRLYAVSVLIDGEQKFVAATNNVTMVVRQVAKWPKRVFALPLFAVDEILRIKTTPMYMGITLNTATFVFPDDIVVHTVLQDVKWPGPPLELLGKFSEGAAYQEIDKSLMECVKHVVPFSADLRLPTVVFNGKTISTVEESGGPRAEVETTVDMGQCRFRAEPLVDVLSVATHADWSKFPRVPWYGGRLKGVLVGLQS